MRKKKKFLSEKFDWYEDGSIRSPYKKSSPKPKATSPRHKPIWVKSKPKRKRNWLV